jgi:hypothetical protein
LKFLSNSKRLLPIPKRIRDDTRDLLDSNLAVKMQKFIERHSKSVVTYNRGTSQPDVKEWLQNRFEFSDKATLNSAMAAAGLRAKSNGTARIYLYSYPDQIRPMALRIRDPDSNPASEDEAFSPWVGGAGSTHSCHSCSFPLVFPQKFYAYLRAYPVHTLSYPCFCMHSEAPAA